MGWNSWTDVRWLVRLRDGGSAKLRYGRVSNTSWSGRKSNPRGYLYFWWEKLEFLDGWVDLHGGTQPHTLIDIFRYWKSDYSMIAIIRPVHNIILIFDHLLGAPAVGLGALITAIATLYTSLKTNRKVLSVKQDMENNHGSSLRDAIDRIENNTKVLTDLVHMHTGQLDDIQTAVRRHDDEIKSWYDNPTASAEAPCAHKEDIQRGDDNA